MAHFGRFWVIFGLKKCFFKNCQTLPKLASGQKIYHNLVPLSFSSHSYILLYTFQEENKMSQDVCDDKQCQDDGELLDHPDTGPGQTF